MIFCVVCLFLIICVVDLSTPENLPDTIEDGKKYTSSILVGREEIKFKYEPLGARVDVVLKPIDVVNGSYYIKLKGDANHEYPCGSECVEKVALSETCTNVGKNKESFETELGCKLEEQPDDEWVFTLTMRCESENCESRVTYELSMSRAILEGYGFNILNYIIYVGALFVANFLVLCPCLCGVCCIVYCCFTPAGIVYSGCKKDQTTICCLCLMVPICLFFFASVVGGCNFCLFCVTTLVIGIIMTVEYWCQYCFI